MALKFLNDGYFAGKVGIGTETPDAKLHVVGDQLIFGDLLLESTANSFRTVSMNTVDGSDNQSLYLCGGATASTARGGYVKVEGNEVASAGGSVTLKAGNVSTGDIDFYTANIQRIKINNAGNVGIGTTSLSEKLEVAGNAIITGDVTLSNGSALRWTSDDVRIEGTTAGDNIKFYVANTEILQLAQSGTLATVTGNLRVTGAYYDSNNSPGTANQVLVSTVTGTDWIDGSAIPGVPAGSGTLNTVPLWTPDGDTLGDSPITISGNDIISSGRGVIENTTNLTTGIVDSLLIKTLSSGTTITNGFGGGLSFYLENTVYSAVNEVGKIAVIETDTIAIDDKMVFSVKDNNILAERLTLTGSEAVFTGNVTVGNNTTNVDLYLKGGTNSNTSINFGDPSDNNVGQIIYRHANNSMSFDTNDIERMRIDSSGNVGIGDTPSFKLDVNVTSSRARFKATTGNADIELSSIAGHDWLVRSLSDDSFAIYDEDAATERMRIDSDGNVGIGTTSPDVRLEVVEASPTDGIVADFVNSTNAGGTTAAIKLSNADSEACDVVLGANRVGANFGSDFFISPSDGVDGTNQERLRITEAGAVKFNAYNSTNNTGTPTYLLGTDASGNIVKTNTVPGSGAGPYLPLAGGTMTGTNGVVFPDAFKLNLGTGSDLQIYHDGSNSYIKDTGTGILAIQGNIIALENTSGVNYFVGVDGAQAELYYNGSSKLQTTSGGIAVTGDINIDSALLSNQENTDVDTGTETVANVAIATYTAAFFDFVIKKTTNVRSGTVYACHDGTNVEFTETSTQDLGDTSDVTLSVDISGGNMRLQATTTSDDWSIKSLIRAI
jgi:hypothetical protein